MPNALSRLFNPAAKEAASRCRDDIVGELDALHGYAYITTSLVELSPDLRKQLLDDYKKDSA